MFTKPPPGYSITGKKDEYYLERVILDAWNPFDSWKAALAAAWEDFDEERAEGERRRNNNRTLARSETVD